MAKVYQLEFCLRGDVIDIKDFETIPDVPSIGDKIHLACDNPNMNDANGYYFKIIDKVSLFFSGNKPRQKNLLN